MGRVFAGSSADAHVRGLQRSPGRNRRDPSTRETSANSVRTELALNSRTFHFLQLSLESDL
jgi:hypothetical protein